MANVELSEELKSMLGSLLAYKGKDRPSIKDIQNSKWLRSGMAGIEPARSE